MKDEEAQPIITTSAASAAASKQSPDGFFGKGKYKFWVIAVILLLAFWSMFTGSLTLNRVSDTSNLLVHDDLDVLEVEEREKLVRQMWDVYTQNRSIRLPKFWQEAFEAAYEDMTGDSAAVRSAAVSEIAKMSLRSIATPESMSNHRETKEEIGYNNSNLEKEKQ